MTMDYGYLNYIGSGAYIDKKEASDITEISSKNISSNKLPMLCQYFRITVMGMTVEAFSCKVVDCGFMGGEIYGPMIPGESLDSVGKFFISENNEEFLKIKLML